MDGAVRFVDVEVLAGAAGRGCPFVPVVITHVPSYWLAGPGGQNINTSVIVLTSPTLESIFICQSINQR
jgi:hypothetical protein